MDQNVILMIVDGFGIGENTTGNAIYMANMPNWRELWENNPHSKLAASGNNVGLPEGIMGNSEVGHLTIGTGRVVFQSLELINQACQNDSLKAFPHLKTLINHAVIHKSSIHLMGLISDGGVHSHQNHLYYLIDAITEFAPDLKAYLHLFTDGRDTPPDSGVHYISALSTRIGTNQNVQIATIIGRYYAMDRDQKWERTKIAYDLMISGIGDPTDDPVSYIKKRYSEGETDEFMKPILVNPKGIIQENDAVLFFNFRPDRARQISMMLNNMEPAGSSEEKNLHYLTMTGYDDEWKFPVLFESPNLAESLSELISKHGMKQVHIAETEKYAHVTYFLNGGQEPPFENESRIMIPSLKVATYDLQPEMSTETIISSAIQEIEKNDNRFIVLNIASPDMVGHTGNLKATIQALENFDEGLGKLMEVCRKNNYLLILTSDHGNCEFMLNNGKIHTAHTTNQVPFVILGEYHIKEEGGLSDIAPTILEILKIPKSRLMNGSSLLI